MDPSPARTTPVEEDDDEWDTDGFVIPSLQVEDASKTSSPKVDDSKLPNDRTENKDETYTGPYRAPPSQANQQEQNPLTRKQKFKQKLKEADGRNSGTERENKVDTLRDLVGGVKMSTASSNNSSRDWLDPHCHESQFERRNR